MIKTKLKEGLRVRFAVEKLGASRRDELYCTVKEYPQIGDEGVIAFPHPNKKLRPAWWYVEWAHNGEKLYVGVTGNHLDDALPPICGKFVELRDGQKGKVLQEAEMGSVIEASFGWGAVFVKLPGVGNEQWFARREIFKVLRKSA